MRVSWGCAQPVSGAVSAPGPEAEEAGRAARSRHCSTRCPLHRLASPLLSPSHLPACAACSLPAGRLQPAVEGAIRRLLPTPLPRPAAPPNPPCPPRPPTASTRCARRTAGPPPPACSTRPGTAGTAAPPAGSAARRWANKCTDSCSVCSALSWLVLVRVRLVLRRAGGLLERLYFSSCIRLSGTAGTPAPPAGSAARRWVGELAPFASCPVAALRGTAARSRPAAPNPLLSLAAAASEQAALRRTSANWPLNPNACALSLPQTPRPTRRSRW